MSWKTSLVKLVAEFGEHAVSRLKGLLPDESTVEDAREALGRLIGVDSPNAPPVKKAPAKKAPVAPLAVPNKPAAPAIIKRVSGANKRAAAGARYDVERAAQQYPKTAPPSLAVDKKTGKEYLQKELSPEAEALGKARRAAQKEIDAGNYTPYFDPAQRFYVNPSPYNLQGDTLIDAMPKRADTVAKYEGMAYDPDALARLEAAYAKGLEYPGAADWYAMGQLEDAFKQQYGAALGRDMFKERFADSMAATTVGADPTSNLLMAQYGNVLKEAGSPVPAAAYDLPYPIGGRFASNNMAMFDKLINKGAGLTTDNPKRFNFSANFLGDTKRATIDEQMSDLFLPGMLVPPGSSYGVFEGALGSLARLRGVDPANYQDVAWAGGKLMKTPKFTPKPMIQLTNEALERTARVTGKDPDEVLFEALVQAKRPTYAKGGLAVKRKAAR
jgi:hypothetical protein